MRILILGLNLKFLKYIEIQLTTLCELGWGLVRPGGLTPEHQAPASLSTQDSYVSKGGPIPL